MTPTEIQEVSESLLVGVMNGGALAGMVFRHSDSALASKKTCITVKAGAPVPQLDGPRGFRVEVEIEIKTSTPSIGAKWHGVVMQRIRDVDTVRHAALSSGLTADNDLYVVDEEIGGDREDTNNLRKRTITVPLIIR